MRQLIRQELIKTWYYTGFRVIMIIHFVLFFAYPFQPEYYGTGIQHGLSLPVPECVALHTLDCQLVQYPAVTAGNHPDLQ